MVSSLIYLSTWATRYSRASPESPCHSYSHSVRGESLPSYHDSRLPVSLGRSHTAVGIFLCLAYVARCRRYSSYHIQSGLWHWHLQDFLGAVSHWDTHSTSRRFIFLREKSGKVSLSRMQPLRYGKWSRWEESGGRAHHHSSLYFRMIREGIFSLLVFSYILIFCHPDDRKDLPLFEQIPPSSEWQKVPVDTASRVLSCEPYSLWYRRVEYWNLGILESWKTQYLLILYFLLFAFHFSLFHDISISLPWIRIHDLLTSVSHYRYSWWLYLPSQGRSPSAVLPTWGSYGSSHYRHSSSDNRRFWCRKFWT